MCFAEVYELVFLYENEEKRISNVCPHKYSYLSLLEDCFRLFQTKSGFLDIMYGSNSLLESHENVQEMFKKHRDKPVIEIKVIDKQYVIEANENLDGGSVAKYVWPKSVIDDSADMEMLINALIKSDDEPELLEIKGSSGGKKMGSRGRKVRTRGANKLDQGSGCLNADLKWI